MNPPCLRNSLDTQHMADMEAARNGDAWELDCNTMGTTHNWGCMKIGAVAKKTKPCLHSTPSYHLPALPCPRPSPSCLSCPCPSPSLPFLPSSSASMRETSPNKVKVPDCNRLSPHHLHSERPPYLRPHEAGRSDRSHHAQIINSHTSLTNIVKMFRQQRYNCDDDLELRNQAQIISRTHR